MADYRIGGMEDYRRAEVAPIANYVSTNEGRRGKQLPGRDTGRQRGVLRDDFMDGGGKDEDYRRNALNAALLSPKAEETKRCGMTAEVRRQLFFTFLLIGSSITGTVCHSLETSFIGHLGKDSMAARSITFSIMGYFFGITNMWAAISTKMGRAVGARDNEAIGKYFKMAIILAAGSGVFTWAIVYPFGPLLMRTIYDYPVSLKPAVYNLAWPYLYIHAIGQPLDYLNGVGGSVLQGMQQLKMYVLVGFLNGTLSGLSNWIAINVLGFGINGSATVHVMRQVVLISISYGYLYWYFGKEAKNPQSWVGSIKVWCASSPRLLVCLCEPSDLPDVVCLLLRLGPTCCAACLLCCGSIRG